MDELNRAEETAAAETAATTEAEVAAAQTEPEQAAQAEPKCVRGCAGKKTSIGGQALIEGVMMRGPHKTVMAVRKSDGTIEVEEVTIKTGGFMKFIKKIPIVRGVFGFADSMITGMKTLMRSAEIAGIDLEEQSEGEAKMEKALGEGFFNFLMGLATILGLALAVLLFFFCPSWIYDGIEWLCNRFIPDSQATAVMFSSEWTSLIHSAIEGILKIAIFVIYIASVSRMPDIKRVFQYHGAEHKSIFCYESGEELTVENARKFKRFHPRCGTSFLILMLILGIIAGMFIPESVVTWLRVLIKLGCIPLIMGVGYELLKICGRYDNFLTRIIAWPGMLMQRLTTKEPDDEQLECALASLIEVIPENTEDDQW